MGNIEGWEWVLGRVMLDRACRVCDMGCGMGME